ncbi:MAG: phosphoglycerate mutase family protein [Lentisphaeria bacterium]|nr:phosphoglycerate mutase family protein [Lentisphaeria bacterium]
MQITFIRHGEIAGDPFIQPQPGNVRGSLSEDKGVLQAEATREQINPENFDMVFSSSYGRALQTAEIIFQKADVPITVLPFLHEWLPDRSLEDVPDTRMEEINARVSSYYAEETWKTDLGEGTFDMCARVCPPFLKELAKIGIHKRHGGFVLDESARELNIAVVAHGGTFNILIAFLLGMAPFPVGRFRFELTGVLEMYFEEAQGVWYPQIWVRNLHEIK